MERMRRARRTVRTSSSPTEPPPPASPKTAAQRLRAGRHPLPTRPAVATAGDRRAHRPLAPAVLPKPGPPQPRTVRDVRVRGARTGQPAGAAANQAVPTPGEADTPEAERGDVHPRRRRCRWSGDYPLRRYRLSRSSATCPGCRREKGAALAGPAFVDSGASAQRSPYGRGPRRRDSGVRGQLAARRRRWPSCGAQEPQLPALVLDRLLRTDTFGLRRGMHGGERRCIDRPSTGATARKARGRSRCPSRQPGRAVLVGREQMAPDARRLSSRPGLRSVQPPLETAAHGDATARS